jgi:hypothetical protein
MLDRGDAATKPRGLTAWEAALSCEPDATEGDPRAERPPSGSSEHGFVDVA